MSKPLPSLDLLNELLSYDPETGKFVWKLRSAHHFATKRSCSAWNAKYAGKGAAPANSVSGYGVLTILYKKYYAHRVAFFMAHGVQPVLIDHADGDRNNNRISNLREVNQTRNFQNLGLRAGNKSGVMGVVQNPRDGRWDASISLNGEHTYLGRWDTFSEAAACRFGAEVVLGFHANHGKRPARQRQQPAAIPVS